MIREVDRFLLGSSLIRQTDNSLDIRQVTMLDDASVQALQTELPSPLSEGQIQIASEKLEAFEPFKPYADEMMRALRLGQEPPYPHLGDGSYGVVYVIEHQGIPYAMKWYRKTNATEVKMGAPFMNDGQAEKRADQRNAQSTKRFYNESEALIRNDNLPFVNQLVAFDLEQQIMVTRLINQASLHELLTRNPNYQLPLSVFGKLTDYMWDMYQQGSIVDLNTKNIFLKNDDLIIHDPALALATQESWFVVILRLIFSVKNFYPQASDSEKENIINHILSMPHVAPLSESIMRRLYPEKYDTTSFGRRYKGKFK